MGDVPILVISGSEARRMTAEGNVRCISGYGYGAPQQKSSSTSWYTLLPSHQVHFFLVCFILSHEIEE